MSGETQITVIGNLTADPELRFLPSGVPVANFSVASTPRHFDRGAQDWKDGEALFLRCAAWRDQGEHTAEHLRKGDRVIVVGQLQQQNWEDKDGNKRTGYQLLVTEIGPSMRFAGAKILKPERASRGSSGPQRSADPWGAPPEDQPPF